MNLRDRRQAFIKITHANYSMAKGSFSPRQAMATFMAVVVALAIFATGMYSSFELILFGYNFFAPVSVLPVAAAYAVVIRCSPQAKTWEDYLDECLAKYDPADKEAFVKLQEAIKRQGWDPEVIRMWIGLEADAIQALEKPSQPIQDSKFLSRRMP